jgi:hypothetical protein
MGFRSRRSVRLIPGVRLTLSQRGVSVSAGVPGRDGLPEPRPTTLPGTDIPLMRALVAPLPQPPPPPPGRRSTQSAPEAGRAETMALASPDLEGAARLVGAAAAQKAALQDDWAAALKARHAAWRRLRRLERLPLGPLLSGAVARARAAFRDAEQEANAVAEAIAASVVRIDIGLDDDSWAAWDALEAAHRRLTRAARLWDVTAAPAAERFGGGAVGNVQVTRKPIALWTVDDDIVATPRPGLRFENANGDDLDLHPGLLVTRRRRDGDYALLDLRELAVSAEARPFAEAEAVPRDAQVIGEAWAKANRDGTPDPHVRNNRRLPVVLYGHLNFSAARGLNESYCVSDCAAALDFAAALKAFQAALARCAHFPGPTRPTPVVTSRPGRPALPALAEVWPAYEVVLAPVALVGVALIVAAQLLGVSLPLRADNAPIATATIKPAPPPNRPTPSPTKPAAVAAAPSVPSQAPSLAPGPVAASQTAAPVRPPAASAPPPPSAPPAAAKLPRLVTTAAARVRDAAERQATTSRVIPPGTVVTAHEQRGDWIRVSDGVAAPWGWVHHNLLKPAPAER